MTIAIGINDLGQVVVQTDVTQDGALKNEGFLFSNFSTQLFLLPNSSSTELLGIDNSGQVVGLADGEAFKAHRAISAPSVTIASPNKAAVPNQPDSSNRILRSIVEFCSLERLPYNQVAVSAAVWKTVLSIMQLR
jgi:hypothetical protein